jgi:Cid1 family poly A polymerase
MHPSGLIVQAEDAAGAAVDHAGCMLLSFLRRYGVEFDRNTQAVAVRSCGIVQRDSLGIAFSRPGILALQDPLTGELVVWVLGVEV